MVCASFYRFVGLPNFRDFREPIRSRLAEIGVLGTVLLAPEGINGSLAGVPEAVETALDFLRSHPEFSELPVRYTEAPIKPFEFLLVRLKKEIVTMRHPIDVANVGTYVNASEWNALLDDPEVTVVDTRNDYEVEVGTFPGALDPHTTRFGEFPDFVERKLDPAVHQRVAMFCTGGIRCEKATALLRERGFKHVYHLQGGILGYLESVAPEENRWQGDCFVFDARRKV